MMKNYFLLLGVCIVFGSCSTEDTAGSIARMLGRSSQALSFIHCKAVSGDVIEFEFSRAVMVKSLNFSPDISIASIEDGSSVRVRLEQSLPPGILITADLVAEDDKRNSINVLIPFRSRNDRMPRLVINELCTENVNLTNKTEFIELKMLSGGNLGAMRIVIIGNSPASKQTIYEFSPVGVNAGEYVVLHLRTKEPSCRNEYNGNKAESGSVNSSPSAWDFFMPGNSKWIQTAASAVYVLDQDDNVLDAVMISETEDSAWPKDYFGETAEFLFQQGEWKTADGQICNPAGAVRSAGTTNTRTICRDETKEDTNTAADWYIVNTSGATSGSPNNSRRWN